MPVPVLGLPKFPSELDYQYSFTEELDQDVFAATFQSGISSRQLRTSHRRRTFTVKFKTVKESTMRILNQFYEEIGGPLKPFLFEPPIEKFGRYTQLLSDGSQKLEDFEDGSLRAGNQSVVVRFTDNFSRTLFKPLLESTGLILQEVLGENNKGKYIHFDGLLESQNAVIADHDQDFLDLGTKDFMFDFLFRGETIFISENADYSALNGKTLIFTINGTPYTVTFTAAAVDAASVVSEIFEQQGDKVEAQVFNGDTWVEVAPKLGAETSIRSLVVFNGKIYGSTNGNGKLYKWDGVNTWVEVAPKLGAETSIRSLVVFNGKIYGGTNPNGKLYEWDGVNTWVEVAPKLGAETNIRSLVVFNGKIYGGTNPNGKLYEWDGVNTWVEVAPKLGAETTIFSLVVFNGKIYGGTDLNGKLYKWDGVNTWVEVAPKLGAETTILSLAVFNGKIYGGTDPNGKLYEWDGVNTWVEVAPQLGAEMIIFSLAVFNGKIYGGTNPNGKLYEWDGVNAWVEVAPKLGAETTIFSLVVFNGKIYGGTDPNGKLYEWPFTSATELKIRSLIDTGYFTISGTAFAELDLKAPVIYPIFKHDGSDTGYYFKQDGTSDLTFFIESSGTSKTITASPSFHLLDGTWHYIVIVIDEDGNGQLYIDNIASGSPVALGSIGSLDNDSGFYLNKLANHNFNIDRIGIWSWDSGDLPADIVTRIATLHADWFRIDNDDGLQVLYTFDKSDGRDDKQQEDLTLVNDPTFTDFEVEA